MNRFVISCRFCLVAQRSDFLSSNLVIGFATVYCKATANNVGLISTSTPLNPPAVDQLAVRRLFVTGRIGFVEQVDVAPINEPTVPRLAGEFVQNVAASQSVDEIVGCRVRGPR